MVVIMIGVVSMVVAVIMPYVSTIVVTPLSLLRASVGVLTVVVRHTAKAVRYDSIRCAISVDSTLF
jgi:hypothetical protein